MMSETAIDTQAEVRRNALVNIRRGLGADAIVEALIDNLHCLQAKLPRHATRNDWYMALAYTIRDRMMDRYIATVTSLAETNTAAKAVAYLSAEFLTGPHLATASLI
jgi:starch phosphorylase